MKKQFRKCLLFSLLTVVLSSPAHGSQVYTFITDTGYYFTTSHEGKISTCADLLSKSIIQDIPYELGPWRGYELEYDDENPVFFRCYQHLNADTEIYFLPVHGRVESRFHTPEVYYINDNWKVKKRGYIEIPSGEKRFSARFFTAQKDEWKHYLVYWFMWHDSRRLMDEGCVMFRIAVYMNDITEEEAKEYTMDFIKHLSNCSIEIEEEGSFDKPAVPTINESVKSEDIVLVNPSNSYYQTRKEAIGWLSGQLVPNDTVPSSANNRRNLILSYQLPKTTDAYPYIFNRSSLYDNGVAAIAFTIEGQFEQTSKIIDAIMRMGGSNGELFFSFDTHNTWPSKDDSYGAIVRSGASAWAGHAIVFYLRARLLETPDIISENSQLQSYLDYAKIIADNMLKQVVTDPRDDRYGLIRGGSGSYVLEFNKDTKKVEEKFVPGAVSWCSVEHNIDVYFFLRDLGKITGEVRYQDAAELIGRRLIEQCWNRKEGQFNRGQHLGQADEVMALDCASWGALFLFSLGRNEKVLLATESANRYANTIQGGTGYKPYANKLIYEDYEVGEYYFPDDPQKSWNDVDMMWTEGSLGVALAHLRIGNRAIGKKIIEEVIKYQSESGGIYHSSIYMPHGFYQAPAVAPTGWLIIVLGVLEDNRIAQLFWD